MTQVTGNLEVAIRKYFTDRVGQEVYLSDVATEFELTYQQVIRAAYRLSRKDSTFVKVTNGVYSYRPSKMSSSGKRIFEELAVTKTGRILIQDENGVVYAAEILA